MEGIRPNVLASLLFLAATKARPLAVAILRPRARLIRLRPLDVHEAFAAALGTTPDDLAGLARADGERSHNTITTIRGGDSSKQMDLVRARNNIIVPTLV
jgi:hypothetical protein